MTANDAVEESKRIYPDDAKHPAVLTKNKPMFVSQTAYDLLEDLRMATLAFAAARGAAEVERTYVNMEMRRRELTVYLGQIEYWNGVEQKVAVKF